jgi:hypothetical protein
MRNRKLKKEAAEQELFTAGHDGGAGMRRIV